MSLLVEKKKKGKTKQQKKPTADTKIKRKR